LEFGAGGSTLWFLRQGCEVTSIEHDPQFFAAMEEVLRHEPLPTLDVAFNLRLVPASTVTETSNLRGRLDERDTEGHKDFSACVYAAADLPKRSVDLLLVDGRARSAVLQASADLVRDDGILVLDNSERAAYKPAMRELEEHGWSWAHFAGPGPYLTNLWRTSIGFRAEPQTATRDL
jgi:predicted O-methyltransferase YrrM